MTTVTRIKTAKKEIQSVLRRYGLTWRDIAPYTSESTLHESDLIIEPTRKVNLNTWKKAAGMLKDRITIDPVKWQRQIRKESERKLL